MLGEESVKCKTTYDVYRCMHIYTNSAHGGIHAIVSKTSSLNKSSLAMENSFEKAFCDPPSSDTCGNVVRADLCGQVDS